MVMGEAFGKSYQYGKRKISSMSNEEFNKLTPKDLANEIMSDYNNIVPALSNSVKASSEFQSIIIRELVDVVKNLPADLYSGFVGNSDPEKTSGIGGGPGFIGGSSSDLGPLGDIIGNIIKVISGGFKEGPAGDFFKEVKTIAAENTPTVETEHVQVHKNENELLQEQKEELFKLPGPTAGEKEYNTYMAKTTKLFNNYKITLNEIQTLKGRITRERRASAKRTLLTLFRAMVKQKDKHKKTLYDFWRVYQNSRNPKIYNHAARNYKTRLP